MHSSQLGYDPFTAFRFGYADAPGQLDVLLGIQDNPEIEMVSE